MSDYLVCLGETGTLDVGPPKSPTDSILRDRKFLGCKFGRL